MRLINFTAKNVYGYLKFNISFNEKITFLVGVNGSGKTTALQLMQALLTPSLRELILIPFADASITYSDGGPIKTISAIKINNRLTISTTESDSVLELDFAQKEEVEYIARRADLENKYFQDIQMKYAENEVFKNISKTSPPVFLGLDRTHRSKDDLMDEAFLDRDYILSRNAKAGFRARRIIGGTLSAGLTEITILVMDAYRQLRRREEKYSDLLREKILLSSFRYTEFSVENPDLKFLTPNWDQKDEILRRENEIQETLRKIELSGESMQAVIRDFFEKLKKLFKSMEVNRASERDTFPIEWVINKAQIDRIEELLRIIDEHKSKISKLYFPINSLLESVNFFYQDTGKSLIIDDVGQLSVTRRDKNIVSVDVLSSGERQILIIFAHLILNRYGSRSNVFVIDEPELSLHLKWQENIVQKISEVSPEIQLIFATHSPEIVGDLRENGITITE